MYTRPATPTDFPTIASISVACFKTDVLYLYTNPGLHTYPLCFRDYWLLRTQRRFWDRGWRFFVAVLDEGDLQGAGKAGRKGEEREGGKGREREGGVGMEGKGEVIGEVGEVVGYSCWRREGESDDATRWQRDSLWARFNRTLCTLHMHYNEFFSLDRSLSRPNLDAYLDIIAPDETYPINPTNDLWLLQQLCVHPSYYRRGIGSLLLRWGKERAREEGILVGLTSSPMAEKMYKREGFWEWKRLDGGEAGDVPVMCWEDEGVIGGWRGRRESDAEREGEDEETGGHQERKELAGDEISHEEMDEGAAGDGSKAEGTKEGTTMETDSASKNEPYTNSVVAHSSSTKLPTLDISSHNANGPNSSDAIPSTVSPKPRRPSPEPLSALSEQSSQELKDYAAILSALETPTSPTSPAENLKNLDGSRTRKQAEKETEMNGKEAESLSPLEVKWMIIEELERRGQI